MKTACAFLLSAAALAAHSRSIDCAGALAALPSAKVTLPTDAAWPDASKPIDTRFDSIQPCGVFWAENSADVAMALAAAQKNAVPFRVRGGRHSMEGYSLVEDGLVLDISRMKEMTVEGNTTSSSANDGATPTISIGAGVNLVEANGELWKHGVAIPAGTCPTVGIAGFTLGGGHGLLVRKYGMAVDHLLEVEMVTVDGTVLTANADTNPDLFWALRGGGGGNFGVVTTLKFDTATIGQVAVFNYVWTPAAGNTEAIQKKLVNFWTSWSQTQPDGLTSILTIQSTKPGTSVVVYGMYDGSLDELTKLLEPLLALGSPSPYSYWSVPAPAVTSTTQSKSYYEVFTNRCSTVVGCSAPAGGVGPRQWEKTKTGYFDASLNGLDDTTVDLLFAQIQLIPKLAASWWAWVGIVQMVSYGGQQARLAPDATAFPHRKVTHSLEYYAQWSQYATAPAGVEAATYEWLRDFQTELIPHTTGGSYVNYLDADLGNQTHPVGLGGGSYLEAYYGANAARLQKVKCQYDPTGVLAFPQGITCPSAGASAAR
jgi:hypothetical protein